MLYLNKYVCLSVVLLFFTIDILAQDIILRTNGAQIDANVLTIDKDTVWFKNKNMYGSPTLGLPKSEIKMIEYWNGKKDYFQGSYVNLSEPDSSSVTTGYHAGNRSLRVGYILFTLENLFTENHLIMDYSNHIDSAFTVAKGKMEFIFENEKNNFFTKLFPTDIKTVFAKFEFVDGSKNKHYDRLVDLPLKSLTVYMNDSVNFIPLSGEESEALQELFSSKKF